MVRTAGVAPATLGFEARCTGLLSYGQRMSSLAMRCGTEFRLLAFVQASYGHARRNRIKARALPDASHAGTSATTGEPRLGRKLHVRQADRTKGRTRLTTAERDELAGSAKRIGSCGRSRASHEGSRQRYGQPRIWKDLREGGRARQ